MPKLDIRVGTIEADEACAAGITQLLVGLRLTPCQTLHRRRTGIFLELTLFFFSPFEKKMRGKQFLGFKRLASRQAS